MKRISSARCALWRGAVLVAFCTALLVGCSRTSSHNDPAYQTPEGDEVAVTCPLSIVDVLGPTKAAEALEQIRLPTPIDPEYVPSREEWMPPGSLGALLPADPISGQLPRGCSELSNAALGSPSKGGFFADEEELDRFGRLCGCYHHDLVGSADSRIDWYMTTTGAREAFEREAREMQRGYLEVDTVDEAQLVGIGDQIVIKQRGTVNEQVVYSQYVLLMRRRNIVAHVELSPGADAVNRLLEYASALDRNILAAAAGQLGTPTPEQ